MEHTFFFDGNKNGISWIIQTQDSKAEQKREHVENFLDKVTDEQSKYIALHVGIFWGIGTFIIKNEDTIKVMLDSKSIYQHLTENTKSSDSLIQGRTHFIKQLIEQRKLKLHYSLIDTKDNQASKLLM